MIVLTLVAPSRREGAAVAVALPTYKRPNAATNPTLGSPGRNCGEFLRPFRGRQRAEGPRQDGGVGGAERGLSRGKPTSAEC
jgi:hypothetical protein